MEDASHGPALALSRPHPRPAGARADVWRLPEVVERPLDTLRPGPVNARTHSPAQRRMLARSIAALGFTGPVLVDAASRIVAGHGRVAADREPGMATGPTVRLDHLTPAQCRALALADNRIAEQAGWDRRLLRVELRGLLTLDDSFDLSLRRSMQDEIPDNLPGDGDAGHGRPPRHSRFCPGQPGNPRGRPKGSRNLATLLQAELRRPVTVTEGGRTRRVQKAAAMVASQVNKAMKGDTRAFNTVLQATRPRAGSWQDADAAGDHEAELAAAHDLLRERFERLIDADAAARERLTAELAAADVAEAHLDLLFGPRGDRLRAAVTAALRDIHARGFDILDAAEHSRFPSPTRHVPCLVSPGWMRADALAPNDGSSPAGSGRFGWIVLKKSA